MPNLAAYTVQNIKFSFKDFFCKGDQIHSFMGIWSNLLKKFLIENCIFCALIKISFRVYYDPRNNLIRRCRSWRLENYFWNFKLNVRLMLITHKRSQNKHIYICRLPFSHMCYCQLNFKIYCWNTKLRQYKFSKFKFVNLTLFV